MEEYLEKKYLDKVEMELQKLVEEAMERNWNIVGDESWGDKEDAGSDCSADLFTEEPDGTYSYNSAKFDTGGVTNAIDGLCLVVKNLPSPHLPEKFVGRVFYTPSCCYFGELTRDYEFDPPLICAHGDGGFYLDLSKDLYIEIRSKFNYGKCVQPPKCFVVHSGKKGGEGKGYCYDIPYPLLCQFDQEGGGGYKFKEMALFEYHHLRSNISKFGDPGFKFRDMSIGLEKFLSEYPIYSTPPNSPLRKGKKGYRTPERRTQTPPKISPGNQAVNLTKV